MSKKIGIGLFIILFPAFSLAGNIRYMPYMYHQGIANKWVSADQFVICDKCRAVEYDIQKAVSAAHKAGIVKSLHIPKQSGLNRLAGLVMKNYLTKTATVKHPMKQKKNSKMKMISEVYFAFDSFNLTKEAKHKLGRIMNWYKNQTLLVEGYTDCAGSRNYNTRLARKRAESAAEYLKKHGMKVNVLKSMGSYNTKKSADLSRRVEVYVCQ